MNSTEVRDIRARKPHKCDWCGETIFSGDIYKSWTNFDDIVYRNKMHPECTLYGNEIPLNTMYHVIDILEYELRLANSQLDILERADVPWKSTRKQDLIEKITQIDVAIKRLKTS